MTFTKWSLFCAVFGGAGVAFGAVGPPPTAHPDEVLLRRHKIGTDNASLLRYLRERSVSEDDLGRIPALVRELGDEDFDTRERASRKLVQLGLVALPELRRALTHKDLELRGRAKECVAQIESDTRLNFPLAVIRLLVERKDRGTVAALLRYLPYTTDPDVEVEIYRALDALATERGALAPEIAAALSSKRAARRAVAGWITARKGNPRQRSEAWRLLRDPDAGVRLRVAQAALAAQEKEAAAVEALVGLLDAPSLELAWQAEELLRWVAGDSSPKALVGLGRPAERRTCRVAWEAWWRTSCAVVDRRVRPRAARSPRLLHIWEVKQGKVEKLWLCGSDGQARWVYRGTPVPLDASFTDGAVVVLEKDEDGGQVRKRSLDGATLWTYRPGARLLACRPLANRLTRVVEVRDRKITIVDLDGKGRVLYETEKPALDAVEIIGAQVEASGLVTCFSDRRRKEQRIEVEPIAGQVVGTTEGSERPQKYWAAWKPTIPLPRRSANTFTPIHGISLGRSNFLVVGKTDGEIGIVKEAGTRRWAPWEVICADHPIVIDNAARLLSLGFEEGQPGWGDDNPPAKRISELRDKREAVRVHAASALARMGRRVEPALPVLVEAMALDSSESVRHRATEAVVAAGPLAVPALWVALRDPRAKVRSRALLRLSCMPDQLDKTVPVVLAGLDDPDFVVRHGAVRAAGFLGSKAAPVASKLVHRLKDGNVEVAREAATALGSVGPFAADDVITPLLQTLKRRDLELSVFALRSIGRFGPKGKPAIPVLVNHLRDAEYRGYHASIVQTLGKMGPAAESAVPTLIELYEKTESEEVSDQILELFHGLGPAAKQAVPLLVKVLQRAKSPLAARTLGRIGPDARDALPLLTKLGAAKTTNQEDEDFAWECRIAVIRIKRR